MALKGAGFRKLKDWQAERKLRKQKEREVYEEAYKKAKESEQMKKIRGRARMHAGQKRKWKKEDYWRKKYQQEKKKKKKPMRPKKGIGYLDVGKDIRGGAPSLKQQERFASLMSTGRGMSLTDFPIGGKNLMDEVGQKKKKKRFSLADW